MFSGRFRKSQGEVGWMAGNYTNRKPDITGLVLRVEGHARWIYLHKLNPNTTPHILFPSYKSHLISSLFPLRSPPLSPPHLFSSLLSLLD